MGTRTKSFQHLIQCAIGVLLIWLVVLPWLGRWGPVERHLQLLEERRIDASVMFYTELEAWPPDLLFEQVP